MSYFDQIAVDIDAGTCSYPELPGFKLDQARLATTVELFAPHCGSVEHAVRLAIHQQLAAHAGLEDLLAPFKKGTKP